MGFHSWCRSHSSGFGSAHALSSQAEDGDRRDEEDEVVELSVCQHNESINGIQVRSGQIIPRCGSTRSPRPPSSPRRRGGANWGGWPAGALALAMPARHATHHEVVVLSSCSSRGDAVVVVVVVGRKEVGKARPVICGQLWIAQTLHFSSSSFPSIPSYFPPLHIVSLFFPFVFIEREGVHL